MTYRSLSSGRAVPLLMALLCSVSASLPCCSGPARASAETLSQSTGEPLQTPIEKNRAVQSAVELTAIPSATKVAIAEPFTLQIEAIAPRGSRVTLNSLSDSLGGFDVLRRRDSPDVPISSTQSRWTWLITLETVQLGEQTIPPIEVTIDQGVLEDDDAELVQTRPVTVEVQSVLAPEERDAPAEFRDIAGTITLPSQSQSSQWKPAMYGLAAGLVLSLLGLAFWFRRRRTGPRRWCLRQLQLMKERSFDEPQSYIETADALKEVLRVELAQGQTAALPPQTTPAILEALSRCSYPDREIQNFSNAFQYADRMKFSPNRHTTVSAAESSVLREAVDHAFQRIASHDASFQSREAGEGAVELPRVGREEG